MASPAAREPGPLVTLVRRRTVENVDSIGLDVLRCSQCGREVVEREQPVQVVADLVGGLGPLRSELDVEALGRSDGVVAVLSVADLGQHLLRCRLGRLR
jgi:hypothetical protein